MTLDKAISYFKAGERGLAEFLGLSRSSLNQIRNGKKKCGPVMKILLKHVGIEVK